MASRLATQLNGNRILCIPEKETERVCEHGQRQRLSSRQTHFNVHVSGFTFRGISATRHFFSSRCPSRP